MRKVMLSLVMLLCMMVTQVSAQWWGMGYGFRQKIQFDNTPQTDSLIDFPVLVLLDSSRIDYSKTANDGSDLRFIDADGVTELNYDIEVWNESGSSYVWVNVPKIDSGSAADHIWMYYNNDEAQPGEDKQNTWNAGYEGVWHMGEATTDEASGETVADVTANSADGTHYGVSGGDGCVSGGQYFDRVNGGSYYDYISLPNTVLSGKSDVTSSFWLKTTRTAAQGLISGAESSTYNNEYLLFLSNDTTMSVYHSSSAQTVNFASVADGQWHHFCIVTDAANDEIHVYIDGVPDDQNPIAHTMGSLTIASGGLMLGQDQDAVGTGLDINQALDGTMDELRISSTVRSGAWVAAQYASMTDAYIFWDSTAVEANPDSLPPDNDLVLSASLVPGTHDVALAWTPGLVDSADAYQVGIWYERNGVPESPGDSSAVMVNVYAMTDSVDTVRYLPNGEYHFMATVRDSSLNVADTAAAARDSALVPNNEPVAGAGSMLDFGGIDEYVAFNDLAARMAGCTDYTIEFWIKGDVSAQNTSYGAALVSINTGTGGNTLLIRMDRTSGYLECAGDHGPSIGDDEWHHVAIVRSGLASGNIFHYIDGVLAGTGTNTTALRDDDRWSLGQEWDTDNTSDHFTGQMDEVRVWSAARTAEEIKAGMYVRPAGDEADLALWFAMDAPGGDLEDGSSEGITGTMMNMEAGDRTVSTMLDGAAVLEDDTLVITAGFDRDGDSTTVTVRTAPDDGSLLIDNNEAGITYIPDPDFFGADTVSYYLTDIDGAVDSHTVTIGVPQVNDAPSYTAGGSDTTDEDAGAQTVAGWATGISAGPANEAGQTLSFVLGNDNADLFADAPDVDETTGDLTYTPAPDAFGEAQITVYLADDGGTDNGGMDETPVDTFMITVNALADDPPVAGSGNALVLDGTGEYVDCGAGTGLDITSTLTVEAWINTGDTFLQAIVGKDDDNGVNRSWHLCTENGKLRFNVWTGTGTQTQLVGSAMVGDNRWVHVAAVYDGSYMKLYVDGVIDDSTAKTGSMISIPAEPLQIGVMDETGGSHWYFAGMIDDIRVWNTARTAQEIADNRFTLLDGTESGLAAYYRFDEVSGAGLPDMSGNDNSGTLVNMDDADWVASGAWRNRDVDENASLVVTAGYDTDADTLDVQLKDGPSNGAIVIDDQAVTVTYTPDPDWFGADTFSYYITDTIGTDSFEVAVSVKTTNQAPVGTGDHTGLTFDGVNDYMDFDAVAPDMAGVTTLCFEFWMKAYPSAFPEATGHHFSVNTASGGNTVLVGCSRSTGQLTASGVASTTNAVAGEWLHFAYVRDGGTVYLYINGELEDTGTTSFTLLSTDNWSLGMELDGSTPTNEYVGEMDEVRVWNTVRSQAEIRDNMHVELNGSESGLVGYWRLNDASGSVAADASGNGNDGSLLYDADWMITGRPVMVAFPAMDEDDTLMVSAGSDPDGDDVFLAEVTAPTNGTLVLDSASMIMVYVPDSDWNGTDTMEYELRDTEGLADTMTFITAVNPVADPVTITSAVVDTAQETVDYAYLVTLDDVDGDAVISMENAPGWMTLTGDTAGGTVPYVHERDTVFTIIAANGTYADTVTVALAIRDTNGVVPVELVSFTASAAGNSVMLAWTTVSERDNLGFNILRSDGSGLPVRVNGSLILGAGTTTEQRHYSFVDNGVEAGTWYYRIQQVDLTGAVTVSAPVTAVVGGTGMDEQVPVLHVDDLPENAVLYGLDGTLIPVDHTRNTGIYILQTGTSLTRIVIVK